MPPHPAFSTESLILTVLIQLTIIIVTARIFGTLARRVGQPMVVGEIAAGLVLGPSFFGKFFPAISLAIFKPEVSQIFTALSQIGLIFLLFLIGLEFDFGHLRTNSRAAVSVSIAGVALPFTLGVLLARWMHPLIAPDLDERGFTLFMGTAMSITAIPILGRIMMELNITRTKIGAVTISAAAIDDASGWILLAAISAAVRSHFYPEATALMIAESAAFALFMIFAARPLLLRWSRYVLVKGQGHLRENSLTILIAILFLSAICTNLIGIFAIFGAFVLGAVFSSDEAFRTAVTTQLSTLVTVFFLPIFFTYTGLRTDIGSLETPSLWGFAALVSLTAIFGKFVGCTVAARLGSFSMRESACIGAMMNTRALMELIVINVGFELGVIPRSVFCMLVIMALVTTVMTTPILLALHKGTELEPYVARSSLGIASAGRKTA